MRSVIESRRGNVAGAEPRCVTNPRNPQYQWELGRSLVEAGRLPDAVRPLEIAVRSDPKFARAHDFLGRAVCLGRRDEALMHSGGCRARSTGRVCISILGKCSRTSARSQRPFASFERALGINPNYGQAYEGLASYWSAWEGSLMR